MVAHAVDAADGDSFQSYSVARTKDTGIRGSFSRGVEEGFGVISIIVKLTIKCGFSDRFV